MKIGQAFTEEQGDVVYEVTVKSLNHSRKCVGV